MFTWASAQNNTQNAPWPNKAVRIIVGFPGGSSPDLTARTLAEPLSKALGQPVIVENRVGAGGNIAADLVAKATDNHTLGLMINGNLTIAKLLNPKVPYDPLKDFKPVSLVGVSPLVLMAPQNAPGADGPAFLAAARQAGDGWSYGSPGVGTVGHIGMELFKAQTGIKPVHVPYPGYAQVANAMIGGQLHLSMLPPALATAQVKGGRLRAIGVTSSGRSPLAPDLPSMAEVGVANFNLEIWNAVAAPKSMPAPVVARLSTLISEIARSPEVRQKLFQQGWQVVGSSPEGLSNRIQSDAVLLGRIIKSLAISSQ
ncbi:tripartite tricarboxylate transporter substrate binding protein [Rhodoferax sp.]|uniref:Bug family tripartite tricarboxylate transporter substrate binding protein n=1 Tax=Rhodoferax sp. TaxID=50421 RepID=UPI002639DA0F|nr:tripartite tricarboxylate transporter substrate binding protein [Rhodoferax sp.]MDD2924422.1 tripartite tricarboxylate transporter substrate binding protein [Rhodoferax sp.]